jgi:hypothetical protein
MAIEVDGVTLLEVFLGSADCGCFKETFMFDFSCNSRVAEEVLLLYQISLHPLHFF